MKYYKLLKDLPTFKAGEKFFISESGNLIAGTPRNPKQITVETLYGVPKKIDLMAYANETLEEFPNILTDWFEEIKEPELSEEFFYIVSNLIGKIQTRTNGVVYGILYIKKYLLISLGMVKKIVFFLNQKKILKRVLKNIPKNGEYI